MTKPTRTQVEKAAREMASVWNDYPPEKVNDLWDWKSEAQEAGYDRIARWHLAARESDLQLVKSMHRELVELRKQLAAKSPATKPKKSRKP